MFKFKTSNLIVFLLMLLTIAALLLVLALWFYFGEDNQSQQVPSRILEKYYELAKPNKDSANNTKLLTCEKNGKASYVVSHRLWRSGSLYYFSEKGVQIKQESFEFEAGSPPHLPSSWPELTEYGCRILIEMKNDIAPQLPEKPVNW